MRCLELADPRLELANSGLEQRYLRRRLLQLRHPRRFPLELSGAFLDAQELLPHYARFPTEGECALLRLPLEPHEPPHLPQRPADRRARRTEALEEFDELHGVPVRAVVHDRELAVRRTHV